MVRFSDYFKEIEDIIMSDDTDKHLIYEITFDDDGHCIHITFTGSVDMHTITALGRFFKDDDPMIEAENNRLKIVVINRIDD